jgi:hypothetical protein
VFDGDALALSMEEVGVGIQRCSLPIAVLDVELLDSLAGVTLRSSGTTPISDDNAEPTSNERRRRRRRGRRRGFREEAAESGPRAEPIEGPERASGLEQAEHEPPQEEEDSDFEPELPEDTEERIPEPGSAAEVEFEEV